MIFPLHLTLCFIANALAQVRFLSPLGRKSSKMSVPDQRPYTPACVRTAQNPGFSKSSFILMRSGVYSSMIHWEGKKHNPVLLIM